MVYLHCENQTLIKESEGEEGKERKRDTKLSL